MSQYQYIKDIAKFGLENDRDGLLNSLNELIEYSKKSKKVNFAIQLQSIIKEALIKNENRSLFKVGSIGHSNRLINRETTDLVLEKVTSDYTLKNIVANKEVISDLKYFIEEHRKIEILQRFDLPISNKLIFHGPSGCGKTLASFIIAGELNKLLVVVNLGAIVSSKLGETSKNLAKLFRLANLEKCILFLDEFDSLGKIRDHEHDHGEMNRVVNTILQLFDYLPQSSIVIAATNQKEMIDDALLRRFDFSIQLNLPNETQIKDLVDLTSKNSKFVFDSKKEANKIIKEAKGLSYYSIQKTLITAIKRSLFAAKNPEVLISTKIKTSVWRDLIKKEKVNLKV